MTLWNKGVSAEDWVTRFTVGEDYVWDTRLLPYDIEGTRIQARALEAIGIITKDENELLQSALDDLAEEAERGDVVVTPQDEDCHTVIERCLTDRLGEIGRKIHTGRSRNDQVLIALRLFLRDQAKQTGIWVGNIIEALCSIGERYDDVLMPGYTHQQRAMPSTPALWAMGYAELLTDDLATLEHAASQINVSPAGSAAGYGVPSLALPRDQMSRHARAERLQLHVTAVQLSRGKLEAQFVHALVQIAATLNRLSADLVLYNSAEFGFVTLPAEYCTGSSIMPQKQNPDVLELSRAAYHRILAEFQMLLTLPANLPSGYHRDLQLTKEAVMRATDRSLDLIQAVAHVLPGVEFDRERLAASMTSELYATAEALRLVEEGVPFRDAYRRAAESVDSIKPPSDEDALGSYFLDGYPGRVRPAIIRNRMRSYLDRLERLGSAS